jgi:hypothetical protein
MAETKKMEGNELFGKACFQQACKKYSEVGRGFYTFFTSSINDVVCSVRVCHTSDSQVQLVMSQIHSIVSHCPRNKCASQLVNIFEAKFKFKFTTKNIEYFAESFLFLGDPARPGERHLLGQQGGLPARQIPVSLFGFIFNCFVKAQGHLGCKIYR